MSSPARRDARALTLLIVWSVALGALFAALLALAPAARAGTCDQVGGVITGDWTITTAQVCSGILYSVDGTISINSGGSLTLTDGGLSFSKDTAPGLRAQRERGRRTRSGPLDRHDPDGLDFSLPETGLHGFRREQPVHDEERRFAEIPRLVQRDECHDQRHGLEDHRLHGFGALRSRPQHG